MHETEEIMRGKEKRCCRFLENEIIDSFLNEKTIVIKSKH